MRKASWLAVLGTVWISALAGGCGEDFDPKGAGGSTTTKTGGSQDTSSSSSSASVDFTQVNGCDPTTSMDRSADETVTIAFSVGVFRYYPPCVKVKAGAKVVFTGDFTAFPLAGGADGTLDPSSPIAETKTGTTATFSISSPGTFPYFCETHYGFGMEGAIYAE